MMNPVKNAIGLAKSIRCNRTTNIICSSRWLKNRMNGTEAPEVQPASANADMLLSNIKSATDASDILMSVKIHHNVMNNHHLIQALKALFMVQKSESAKMTNREILRSEEFKTLCNELKKEIKNLDIDDRIAALKTLCYLGVACNTRVMQLLLQSMIDDLVELSLQQITFFDFLIKDFENNTLVEALHIALPLIFDAYLERKMESNSFHYLTDLLHYATRKNLTSASLVLIDHIMAKRSEMDFKGAKSVVRSLCELKVSDDRYHVLLSNALDILVDNYTRFTYHDYDVLLSKMLTKYLEKNRSYYHKGFVDSAIKQIIESKCGFTESLWILKKASKFGHVSYELLDYLIDMVDEDPSLVLTCGTLSLFTLVKGLAQADYRPSSWSDIEFLVVKNAVGHLTETHLPWIGFVRDLCVLQSWSEKLIGFVFSQHFQMKCMNEFNLLDHLQMMAIYQTVKQFVPNYKGPWPAAQVQDYAILSNGLHLADSPLEESLVQGLGGTRYVVNAVVTKYGHYIDHVIGFRKGGYPVAFMNIKSEPRVFLEDLQELGVHQMTAVLHLPSTAYTLNTGKLKGPTRLMIQTLEQRGVKVVYVNAASWYKLMDAEKVPYIMNLIKTTMGA